MNKFMPLIIVAVIAVAAGITVALTSSDDKPANSDNPKSSSTAARSDQGGSSADSSQAAATNDVEIKDFAYGPTIISVKKGTTVTWTNKDSAAHTVTADSGNGPKSESLAKDDTYSFTFNETGEFSYHCIPHPQMKGKVVVTD